MLRRLLRLFLGALALLQGMSPLLHAHVMPTDGGQTGLHVHAVAVGPARDCGRTMSLTLAGAAEPAAITAPTEHRRDESLVTGNLAAPARALPLKAARSLGSPPCVACVPATGAALRIPPARGPPAVASFT